MSSQTPLQDRDEDDIRGELCAAVDNAAGKDTDLNDVDAEVASASEREKGLVGRVRAPAGVKLLLTPRYDDAPTSRCDLNEQLGYKRWEAGELTLHEDGSVSITVWEPRFSDT